MAKKSNGVTRKEAVRQALSTLGEEASRPDLQKFVKEKYGYEMTLDHISNTKSEFRKEKPAAAKPPSAQKPGPKKAAWTRYDMAELSPGD